MKHKLHIPFGGDTLILIASTVLVLAMFTLLNRTVLMWTTFTNILEQDISTASHSLHMHKAPRRAGSLVAVSFGHRLLLR